MQDRLIEKWGVKQADDVVSKGGRVAERTADLNKVLKAMPENLVDDFTPDKAVKFLGDKKFAEAAEKLAKSCLGASVLSAQIKPAAKTCTNLLKNVKTADELEDALKGVDYIEKNLKGGLDSFQKSLTTEEKVRLITKIGKYGSLIKQKGWVRYVGTEPLQRGLPKSKLGFNNPEDVFMHGFKAGGNEDDLLAHVGGSTKSRFIPTTGIPQIAKNFATKEFSEGYIFNINPRALNGIDTVETLRPKVKSGEINREYWDTIIEPEKEIAFIDAIDAKDIVGYQKVDHLGNPIGDFVKNKNYVG